jgi:hypothetical protein
MSIPSAYPTPIGPKETVEVVDAVPPNSFLSSLDDTAFNFLRETFSLEMLRKPRVNQNLLARRTFKQASCCCPMSVEKISAREDHTPKLEVVSLHADFPRAPPESINQKDLGAKKGHWFEKYKELDEFRKEFGHCLVVPNNGPKNVKLAQWVKRQRHQYKCRSEGKHSHLTDDRMEALENLGFIWSVQEDTWEERFNELGLYKEQCGHCNVPQNCSKHPQLAVWVKYQRRHLKLFIGGKRSSMTQNRFVKLTKLEFQWNPRPGKRDPKEENAITLT